MRDVGDVLTDLHGCEARCPPWLWPNHGSGQRVEVAGVSCRRLGGAEAYGRPRGRLVAVVAGAQEQRVAEVELFLIKTGRLGREIDLLHARLLF